MFGQVFIKIAYSFCNICCQSVLQQLRYALCIAFFQFYNTKFRNVSQEWLRRRNPYWNLNTTLDSSKYFENRSLTQKIKVGGNVLVRTEKNEN